MFLIITPIQYEKQNIFYLGCVDISSAAYVPRFIRGIHKSARLIIVYFKQACTILPHKEREAGDVR